MTLQSLLVFVPSIVSGGALAHLVWRDRSFKSILLKLFLGFGLGLGVNSLLFFIYLLIFDRKPGFFGLQILLMILLISVLILQEKPFQFLPGAIKWPGRAQVVFLALAGGILALGSILFITVSLREPQGAWDSWMIYNRAARFIFRGGEHWSDAFSPALYWFFHTDYPPLVALNVASGWNALGQETIRVPMAVGWFFWIASAGIIFAGLNAYKTLGQASLGLLVLLSVSDYTGAGAKQTADVPVAFFILATGILISIYSLKPQRGLLVLAGLSAGLAAWTKNEGMLYVLVSLVGLGVAYWKEMKQVFPWYLLGLALPMTILVYFKINLAPPGDLFVDVANQMKQIIDLNRHSEIVKQLARDLNSLLGWAFLFIYALVLGVDRKGIRSTAFLACLSMILLQVIGYYSILLISPHPILWHLSALYRLLLQVAPLMVFIYFSVVKPPETVFQTIAVTHR